jgi:hypothetical protein
MAKKLSFENDIRPLFTEEDIGAMRAMGLDLAAVEPVRKNALRILTRLASKTMPPNRPWPDDQVDRFRTWVNSGMGD